MDDILMFPFFVASHFYSQSKSAAGSLLFSFTLGIPNEVETSFWANWKRRVLAQTVIFSISIRFYSQYLYYKLTSIFPEYPNVYETCQMIIHESNQERSFHCLIFTCLIWHFYGYTRSPWVIKKFCVFYLTGPNTVRREHQTLGTRWHSETCFSLQIFPEMAKGN